jgi:hypothetical protein
LLGFTAAGWSRVRLAAHNQLPKNLFISYQAASFFGSVSQVSSSNFRKASSTGKKPQNLFCKRGADLT